MKTCNKCNQTKDLKSFHKKGISRDGYAYSCKQCVKQYKQHNQSHLKEYSKKYREQNKDKIRDYKSEYYKKNKDKLIKQDIARNLRKRRESDLERLKHNIRSNILRAYKSKGFTKRSRTTEILGCSIEDLKTHLEETFYNRYGRKVSAEDITHIDHIIPVADARSEEELVQLNHYTNLQLLLSTDNLKKGTKHE